MISNPQISCKRWPDRPGVAVVVTVLLISLLSLMILAFLMIASNSRLSVAAETGRRQADQLVRQAAALSAGEIKAMMAASSNQTVQVDARQKVMRVTDSAAMLPARRLKDPALEANPDFRNLVLQSVSGSAWQGGRITPANVPTTAPASDGRFIAASTWAEPRLFFGNATLAANQVPDWIYLTRNGTHPTANAAALGKSLDASGNPNPEYVIGRYACNVYELGGLLDLNVAGHPAGYGDQTIADGLLARAGAGKDSPFWADLSLLPGAPGDFGSMIANWRNRVSLADGPEPLVRRRGEATGWREIHHNPSGSDDKFLSRQDLLKFQKADPARFPEGLLPYLTHANFALNQPSHRPDPARPKIRPQSGGGNDASGFDNEINSAPLELRTRIAEQTTPLKPTVPAIPRRFPLDRLNLVVPGPSKPDEVARFFGLRWNASSNGWDSINSNIARLSAVAAQDREPNLLELLKATIHAGSLAVPGTNLGHISQRVLDQSLNYHVVQLAANLIDQWDSDHFPTRITFDGRDFYGIEDLPRIHYVRSLCYRQSVVPASLYKASPAGPPPPLFEPIYDSVYLRQPVIWNPHASGGAGIGTKPSEFRVIAISNAAAAAGSTAADVGCAVYHGVSGAPAWTGLGAPATPIADFRRANGPNYNVRQLWTEANSWITFRTTESGPASFRQPYPLKSPNYPRGSNAAGPQIHSLIASSELNDNLPDAKDNRAIGFFIGKLWVGSNIARLDPSLVFDNGVRYELQYKSGGAWITYDILWTPPFIGQDRVGASPADLRHFHSFFRIDPRTSRLGVWITNAVRGWPTANPPREWYFSDGQGPSPGAPPGNFIGGNFIGDISWPGWEFGNGGILNPGYVQINQPGNQSCYPDADGVIRPAMGANRNGLVGLPMAAGNERSRPVVLNRPFRSLAELGRVFRDLPWRQFDFSQGDGADAALLDVFCLHSDEEFQAPEIARGRINPNRAPAECLAALLAGSVRGTNDEPISQAEAAQIAIKLRDWLDNKSGAPRWLKHRGAIVGIPGSPQPSAFSEALVSASSEDRSIGHRREAVIRALADSTDVRTWNLMIDVVAQAGRVGSSGDLRNFVIDGQQRHWVFLSIDRFTGEIIHRSHEPVY